MVAITGASGAIYGLRFLREASLLFEKIYLSYSEQATQVAQTELNFPLSPSSKEWKEYFKEGADKFEILDRTNFFTPPASGSFRHDGMVIVPCSMGTAGRIANGISDDLVTRAADVCLKEKRKLILVIRETPLNLVHLRNLTQLAEAGAIILPASPGFYYNPKSVEDLVDTIIARILQNLGVDQKVMPQWRFQEETKEQ